MPVFSSCLRAIQDWKSQEIIFLRTYLTKPCKSTEKKKSYTKKNMWCFFRNSREILILWKGV